MNYVSPVSFVATPLLIAVLSLPALSVAQTAPSPGTTAAPLTRAEVKMERQEFVKTHRYDPDSETWVLKEGFEPPAGLKTRAEVKSEREAFLRTHRWNPSTEVWDSITPEQGQAKTREQVRGEAKQFAKTHEWDPITNTWSEKTPRRSKSASK